MFENYKVAVKVSLINEVSAGLLLIARQFGMAGRAATAFQTQLTAIKNTAKGGAFLIGGAGALAAPFIYAIDKAAELQKQMLGIQVASRGTNTEMDQMRKTIEAVAAQTVFSNVDVAKMGKLVATGTGLGAQDVTKLLPEYAKFADVQYLMKGSSYEQSVSDAIRLAHTAQHYDPASLGKYLDLLTKASFIIPGSLSEVGHALKYSQGVAKTALGVNDEQMVLMTALLNRLGFAGSRGGTNLIAAMTRTIPGIFGSGLLTGKSGESLRAMGMVDASGHSKVFNKEGKFDSFLWMGLLSQYVQREFARNPEAIARQNIMRNFQHAFGVQGSRVASLLSDPQAIDQLLKIGEAFQGYGGVESIQKKFADESVAQQYMNAKTNFGSAMTELGTTLLPLATDMLKKLNTNLGEMIKWITENQSTAKGLAYAFLGLASAMAFGGSVLLLTAGFKGLALVLAPGNALLSGLMGMNVAAAAGATSVGDLSAAIMKPMGLIGAIGAAIAAIEGLWQVSGWLSDKIGKPTGVPGEQQKGFFWDLWNYKGAIHKDSTLPKVDASNWHMPSLREAWDWDGLLKQKRSDAAVTNNYSQTTQPVTIHLHNYLDGKDIGTQILGPENMTGPQGLNPLVSRPMPGTPGMGY